MFAHYAKYLGCRTVFLGVSMIGLYIADSLLVFKTF